MRLQPAVFLDKMPWINCTKGVEDIDAPLTACFQLCQAAGVVCREIFAFTEKMYRFSLSVM